MTTAAAPIDDPHAIEVTVTFEADWHVGSGAGRPGDVDRLVQRDGDGLPCVPAKTLIGVWRDACERVAVALDDGAADGAWQQLAATVFGTAQAGEHRQTLDRPRPAALTVRPLRLSPPLRGALAHPSRRTARQACTLVRPGVRVDDDTGQARAGLLRFDEVARRGLRLHGRATLALDGDADEAARALLVAAAATVERLGGKRRRGLGRCRVTLDDHALDDALDYLDDHPVPPTAALPAATGRALEPDRAAVRSTPVTGDTNQAAATDRGSWQVVSLRLVPPTPVVAAAATVGNVIESHDYVPGRMLLPHVAAALAAAGVDPTRAIAVGDLVVTDAVPVVAGQRAHPTPGALAVEKGGALPDATAYNRLVERGPDGVQLKAVRGGWIDHPAADVAPTRVTTPMQVATHNTIDDATQRPTGDVGGVFTYQAIAAGVELAAEVRLAPGLAAQLAPAGGGWHERLAGQWQLGRSRKDDYGLVEVSASAPQPVDATTTDAPTAGRSGGEVTVWLLSDTVVVDEALGAQPTVQAVADALGRALEATLTVRDPDPNYVDAAVWTRRTEGWQTRWGLPRPSTPAVGAGSCFVAAVDGQLDAAAVTAVETAGIGQRRAEGLGQVWIDPPLLTTPASPRRRPADPGAGEPPPFRPVDAADADADIAALVERAAARSRIRDAAEQFAANATRRHEVLGWSSQGPPSSQLGGLQSALIGDTTLASALAWAGHLADTPNRRDKWPADSLGTLRRLLAGQDRDAVWHDLQLDGEQLQDCLVTDTDPAGLRADLRDEAVRLLLLAALRHHRRHVEEQPEPAGDSRVEQESP